MGSLSIYSSPRRVRRGAALLITVLITVAAATITLVLVKQGLDLARNEANKTASRKAVSNSEDLRLQFEQDLAEDPIFYLRQVGLNEPPRICVSPTETKVIQPGDVWPSECGTSWDYKPAETDAKEVLRVSPPSSERSQLHADFASRYGTTMAGVRSNYAPGRVDRPLLADLGSLNLHGLASGGASTNLSGVIYSRGIVTSSEAAQVDANNATFISEEGFSGNIKGSFRAFSRDVNTETASLVPTPFTSSSSRNLLMTLEAIGCAKPGPADQLCLKEGNSIRSTDGTSTELPLATSWLVLPTESGNFLEIYYSSTPAKFVNACSDSCDVLAQSATLNQQGEHPGGLGYWTKLPGEYPYPSSGVLQADSDLHVGLCGEAFLDATKACLTRGPTPEVSTFTKPISFVAGTLADPASLYISGSIAGTATSKVGLVASSSIFLPSWAHKPQGVLSVHASVSAYGTAGQSIQTLPAAPEGAVFDSFAGDLRIEGALLGRDVSLSAPAFKSSSFAQDADLLRNPPPYSSTLALNWDRIDDERISPDGLFELFQ